MLLLVGKYTKQYDLKNRHFAVSMAYELNSCKFSRLSLAGPLPESSGFMYLLTCVGRFYRLLDAFPI